MPKVMIVDDDKTTADLLKTLLELDGFDVVVLPDAESAMSVAHETAPDAFLVDYHLADIDGTAFARDLRNDDRFQAAPIIITSGLDREDEAIAAGADRFLIKPFEPSNLTDILNQLLE